MCKNENLAIKNTPECYSNKSRSGRFGELKLVNARWGEKSNIFPIDGNYVVSEQEDPAKSRTSSTSSDHIDSNLRISLKCSSEIDIIEVYPGVDDERKSFNILTTLISDEPFQSLTVTLFDADNNQLGKCNFINPNQRSWKAFDINFLKKNIDNNYIVRYY